MNRRPIAVAALVIAAGVWTSAARPIVARSHSAIDTQQSTLSADLDAIFASPVLARAVAAARFDSLATRRTLYARDAQRLVVPASNMKVLVLAAAAERLGWDFTYETRLEALGPVESGVLRGDLIVVGGGDPTMTGQDFGPSPMFFEWAEALQKAGIRRIEGRIIGDDDRFDDELLGAGWSWDYLAAGYAAPVSALSYNENQVVVRAWPGTTPGAPVRIDLAPAGHGLVVANELQTGAAGSVATISLARLPGSPTLTIRGSLPAGGNVVIRAASVDNPTRFFVEGLRLALAERAIVASQGAFDIDAVAQRPSTSARRLIVRRISPPLSMMAGTLMKTSLNFDTEALLKALGAVARGRGTTEAGREAVLETLASWGVPADAVVMYDGSGLSRYDYITADALVTVLTHVWNDPRLRGPFVASLPVGGQDGTLANRMRGTSLDANVRAKTGSISNVRALSGYVTTPAGDTIVFSIVVNHFTGTAAEIDAVVDKALERIAR